MPLSHDHTPDPTGEVRRCAHCNAPIIGRRKGAIYHSPACQIAAEQRRYQQRNKERLAAYHRDYRKRRKAEG
jgi:hypothetical protein